MVQDGATVNFAADLKGDARRDVGFNQAGNHIHTRALGRQNQMDAGSARFLGQAGDQLFDFLAHHHHQVGQLVNHHHDMRQAVQWLRVFGGQAKGVVDKVALGFGLVELGIKTSQITHTHFAHQLVALFHFTDTPVQAVRRLTHIGHHGRE